jgi:hypothetical protein
MGNARWFNARMIFKDGKLRESGKSLLKEVFLELVNGDFGDGCWRFPGGKRNHEGYAYVTWKGYRSRMAHHLIYEIFKGEIPSGKIIMHTCDHSYCCNPNHLRLGTYADNSRDMALKGRARNGMREKTHCPHGHEYNEENTIYYYGHRYCRACHKIYSTASAARKRLRKIQEGLAVNL